MSDSALIVAEKSWEMVTAWLYGNISVNYIPVKSDCRMFCYQYFDLELSNEALKYLWALW